MAVIPGKLIQEESGITTVTWSAITTADTGSAVETGNLENITIHVVGSGTAVLEGSNNNVNFVAVGAGAMAANSLNSVGPGATLSTVTARYLRIGTVATATVTVILQGLKKRM